MPKFLILIVFFFSASTVNAAVQEPLSVVANDAVQADINGDGVSESDDAKAIDHHEDLYAAINESADEEALVDEALSAIREVTLTDEWMLELEAESPGFIDVYMQEIRKPVALSIQREFALERSRFVALFRTELTEQEAAELATLFRTEAFRRMMQEIFIADLKSLDLSNVDLDAQMTAEEIEKRDDDLARKAMDALSSEERGEVGWKSAINPAFRKFNKLESKMLAIRLELENRPTDPDIDEAFVAATDRAFEEHFPEDY